MEENDETRRLLREILDVEREHLAEFRRATQAGAERQERALFRQERAGSALQRVSLAAGILVAALLALLGYLLVRYSRQFFGI